MTKQKILRLQQLLLLPQRQQCVLYQYFGSIFQTNTNKYNTHTSIGCSCSCCTYINSRNNWKEDGKDITIVCDADAASSLLLSPSS